MTGLSFKTVLFYAAAAYLCLAARAAPAAVTTPSPMPTASPSTTELETTTTDGGSAMLTTIAPESDGPVVPPFQCSTPQSITDYQRSVSLLASGFVLATRYINRSVGVLIVHCHGN